ncbi:hypothetical protein RH728_004507 [Vibrio vulnificus]|uniref:hypothetical protein n=1 Tax=Gammaproteobacteria TaxID=1236 RepID=UPI0006644B2C|nr:MULTISPECIES: hypothetical protein [Vibrio]EHK9050677.1 hypothetical protein [Vibrio vulnificus]EIJ0985438.1 hypothetical protein [Vibrio vulnificus]EKA6052550.1 hypothetical protein [Vibrio vulnificus]ELB7646285.1 hypothetical protein [Vibrio vulnificus]OEC22795.1 hypothetical protein BFX10_18335 [Vibrio cholerae]
MEIGKFSIKLDKRWELRDLSIVTREYVQLYSFMYVAQRVANNQYVDLDFSTYPWSGGFSVVNFFQSSYSLTKEEHRIQVSRLQYASPGFIELSGAIEIAAQVATLVTTLCGSAMAINKTYDAIVRSYHKRKLGSLKIQEAESKLSKDDIEFIRKASKDLATNFNLTSEQIKAIQKMTNKNELVQLKILLALYRRASPIVEQQLSGKAKL